MRNTITISCPRVIESKGRTRLEADTSWQYGDKKINETIFFEVDEKWGKYFVFELSDPFVLALLEIGFENGYDIQFEAPLSEDLKYQLETYLIPIMARKIPALKPFKLIGGTSNERIKTENVTGTGFSAGVDSFYSVLAHKDSPYKSKKVTHLLLTVNGAALTGFNAETDKKWYEEELKIFQKLADEMGLQLIGVNSNISLLNKYRKLFKGGDGIVTSSFVHSLKKLFGTYYWASTYEADILEFRTDDLGYVEPFYLPLLSVKDLRFYHSGAEVNRMEKVEFIADNPIVRKGLTVCWQPKSCGICFKCTRTMAELYSIGKLQYYSQIFPGVGEYEKKLGRRLGLEMAQDHPPFTTEILESFKKNNKKIPFSSYLWKWFYFKPLLYFKKKLKYNKFFLKLYFEKGWLERLGGRRPSEDIVKAKLSGEKFEK